MFFEFIGVNVVDLISVVDMEIIILYEGGVKFILFNGFVCLNLVGFYWDVDDL